MSTLKSVQTMENVHCFFFPVANKKFDEVESLKSNHISVGLSFCIFFRMEQILGHFVEEEK